MFLLKYIKIRNKLTNSKGEVIIKKHLEDGLIIKHLSLITTTNTQQFESEIF